MDPVRLRDSDDGLLHGLLSRQVSRPLQNTFENALFGLLDVVCRLGSLYIGEEDVGVVWFPVRLVNGSGENSGMFGLELSHNFGDHVNEGLGF